DALTLLEGRATAPLTPAEEETLASFVFVTATQAETLKKTAAALALARRCGACGRRDLLRLTADLCSQDPELSQADSSLEIYLTLARSGLSPADRTMGHRRAADTYHARRDYEKVRALRSESEELGLMDAYVAMTCALA